MKVIDKEASITDEMVAAIEARHAARGPAPLCRDDMPCQNDDLLEDIPMLVAEVRRLRATPPLRTVVSYNVTTPPAMSDEGIVFSPYEPNAVLDCGHQHPIPRNHPPQRGDKLACGACLRGEPTQQTIAEAVAAEELRSAIRGRGDKP